MIRDLVERGGSEVMLIAGAREDRLPPVRAALRAHLATTLVTDPDFAWNVLCAEVPALAD